MTAEQGSVAGRKNRIEALGYDYGAQEKEWIPACNLCGSERWTVLTHRDRYGFAAQTMACNRCGLSFLNPRMTASAYAKFYEETYRPLVSAYHGRQIDAVTVQREQEAYAVEMARLLSPYLVRSQGASFLDVGGSTGVVAVHFAKRFGLRPTVIDPAPEEIREAKALGIETVAGFIEDWDPGSRTFDVIGMFQTIDHLLDASMTLRKLRSLLSEDGLLILDIVDFRAAYLKNWSVEGATKIDHPFSFTEETAEALLARSGFSVQRRAYSEDLHLVAYACRPDRTVSQALPSPAGVERFFREVRFIQNAPRPGAPAI